MVRIMIREGQNKNGKTQNMGNTPLHIAARNGHYLIAKYLKEIGASLTVKNEKDQTPIQFLQEALITDPVKLEKMVAKQKTKALGQKMREQQGLMTKINNLFTKAEEE